MKKSYLCGSKTHSMKNTLHRIGLFLLLFIGMATTAMAQSTLMTIHLNDGSEQVFTMSESDRAYFEDNQTLVIKTESSTNRFSLDDIRKITCDVYVGTSENTLAAAFIYPNPVHDNFSLHNLSGKETLRIYALDGRLVKTAKVTGNQSIDISDLPVGLYLVKMQSQTLKMIKL